MSTQNNNGLIANRCVGDPLDAQPDETWDRNGSTVALWGQGPCVPHGEWIDPIPSVYSSDKCGGQIEVGDYPFSLDDAEACAHRILAAVKYQRQEARRAETARITSIAAGNAVTHDWAARDRDARCSRCRTIASVRCIQLGQVPTCGEAQANRCPLGWHAISFHVVPGRVSTTTPETACTAKPSTPLPPGPALRKESQGSSRDEVEIDRSIRSDPRTRGGR